MTPTITYGFTKDDGFAIVDDCSLATVYGYPTSPLHSIAKRNGAQSAAFYHLHTLKAEREFLARMTLHNADTPYGEEFVAQQEAKRSRILASIVEPAVLEVE